MDLEVSVLALVLFHCLVLSESLSKLRHRLTFTPCHYGYSMFNADIAVEPVDACACSGAAARLNCTLLTEQDLVDGGTVLGVTSQRWQIVLTSGHSIVEQSWSYSPWWLLV